MHCCSSPQITPTGRLFSMFFSIPLFPTNKQQIRLHRWPGNWAGSRYLQLPCQDRTESLPKSSIPSKCAPVVGAKRRVSLENNGAQGLMMLQGLGELCFEAWGLKILRFRSLR